MSVTAVKYTALAFLFACCSLLATAQHKVDPTSQFTISGLVEKPLSFDIAAIKKQQQISLGDVMVKNHRGEDKKMAKNVKGVLLKKILDSVHFKVEKPKQYSELIIVLIASDGYKNVYSWNELFNTEVGNAVYIITERDGKDIAEMDGAITIVSAGDMNAGSRYLKGLQKIEIRRVE